MPTKVPTKELADKSSPTSDITTISRDLVISDSDSEPEEGEILDIDIGSSNISPVKTEQTPKIPLVICEKEHQNHSRPSTSTNGLEELKSNEYIPAYVTKKPTHTPEYHPMRRTGREDFNKRATAPTYQILFDLWRMVRNCDHYIGTQMEKSNVTSLILETEEQATLSNRRSLTERLIYLKEMNKLIY